MDNAHFTFVDGHLRKIDCVGAGGIIGDPHQNWNWNLYLTELKKQYGQPTKMAADEAVWVRGDSVVHAFLTVEPMMFDPSKETQTEHIELQNKNDYEEQKSRI